MNIRNERIKFARVENSINYAANTKKRPKSALEWMTIKKDAISVGLKKKLTSDLDKKVDNKDGMRSLLRRKIDAKVKEVAHLEAIFRKYESEFKAVKKFSLRTEDRLVKKMCNGR